MGDRADVGVRTCAGSSGRFRPTPARSSRVTLRPRQIVRISSISATSIVPANPGGPGPGRLAAFGLTAAWGDMGVASLTVTGMFAIAFYTCSACERLRATAGRNGTMTKDGPQGPRSKTAWIQAARAHARSPKADRRRMWWRRRRRTSKLCASMASKEIRLPRCSSTARLVGVVSDRDYARKVVPSGEGNRATTPVEDIMNRDVVSVGLVHTIPERMGADERVRLSLPPVIDPRSRDRCALRWRSSEEKSLSIMSR